MASILALHITLIIFSGRPDPEWQIKQGDANYQKIFDAFQDAKKNSLTSSFNQIPARLGYRGFLIQENNQGLANASSILGPNTKELQKLLLQTAPENKVPKSLVKSISKAIDNGQK